MHFLDAWTELALFDLVRLLLPAGLLLVAILLPGDRVARLVAFGMALTVPLLLELGLTPFQTAGWALLWLVVGWRLGAGERGARRPLTAGHGTFESGTVGVALGLVLLAVLVAAVARQDLPLEEGRSASGGALLLGLGLLYLMLRRHARRAVLAFAAVGLGLQMLEGAARGAQVPGTGSPGGGVLLATAVGVALTLRVAGSRQRFGGSAFVSDAHDLHD